VCLKSCLTTFFLCVSGPYVLGAGALTFLLSKEIYVVEHEFYTGVAIAIMGTYGVKKFGKQIADYADKGIGVSIIHLLGLFLT